MLTDVSQVAGEALVFFFAIRAVIACLLSLFGLDWIAATGVKNVSHNLHLAFGVLSDNSYP
jgi:hypothetical protein